MIKYSSLSFIVLMLVLSSCKENVKPTVQDVHKSDLIDPELVYEDYEVKATDRVISRAGYKDQLYGFWLGQCIANWTGLVTEMDKIGNIGEVKTGDFYTREDWGKPDRPSI